MVFGGSSTISFVWLNVVRNLLASAFTGRLGPAALWRSPAPAPARAGPPRDTFHRDFGSPGIALAACPQCSDVLLCKGLRLVFCVLVLPLGVWPSGYPTAVLHTRVKMHIPYVLGTVVCGCEISEEFPPVGKK